VTRHHWRILWRVLWSQRPRWRGGRIAAICVVVWAAAYITFGIMFVR
jgi:hypothetical protein